MRKLISVVTALVLIVGMAVPVGAATKAELDAAVKNAAAYMRSAVKKPEVGSIGGEWAVLGLARSGYDVPDSYYANYLTTVERYVKERSGVLHKVKYTEYSRVILALTAAGYDPRDVAGYDLTKPLGDFEKTIWQGINGPVFALIALDSRDYPVPANGDAKTQATREKYIAEILRRQTRDGGWNLTSTANSKGDADLTGMALQALAKYQEQPEVKTATDQALAFLSGIQDANGGYGNAFSVGSSAVESAAQVLVALCELGIPVDDARFVKNGKSLVDNVLSYRNADGSYRHTQDGDGNNQMATEQAFYALVAAQRAQDGKSSLYRMKDDAPGRQAAAKPTTKEITVGLPGKHADVRRVSQQPGRVYADIEGHADQAAIEALVARNIMGDSSARNFAPDAAITRAEFVDAITRGLGLPEKTAHAFTDVSAAAWYAKPVATACHYQIITDSASSLFNPNVAIARQDAAVMIANAAKLCGMDTDRTEAEIRDVLAQFGDYRTVAGRAQSAMAFCCDTGLLDDTNFDIEPSGAVTRCEAARMLYRMLVEANLIE